MLRNNPELKAAEDAVDLLSTLNLSTDSFDLIFTSFVELIVTSIDPKAFVQALIDYMKDNNFKNEYLEFLKLLQTEDKLANLIDKRKNNKSFKTDFTVADYLTNKDAALTLEEAINLDRAYQQHGTFKPTQSPKHDAPKSQPVSSSLFTGPLKKYGS